MATSIFNNSGDFRGAQVNQNSNIKNQTLTVTNNFSSNEEDVTTLQKHLAELQQALEDFPKDKSDDANAIVDSAKYYVEEACAEKPDQSKLKSLGRNLTVMAKSTMEYAPKVIDIVSKMVGVIAKVKDLA